MPLSEEKMEELKRLIADAFDDESFDQPQNSVLLGERKKGYYEQGAPKELDGAFKMNATGFKSDRSNNIERFMGRDGWRSPAPRYDDYDR